MRVVVRQGFYCIGWRGGDNTIKSAVVGCRVLCAIDVCIERVRVGLMDYG